MDYARIFPDLFRQLRDHFFEERKRMLRKNTENMLQYLSGRSQRALLARAGRRSTQTLQTMMLEATGTASTARRTRSSS